VHLSELALKDSSEDVFIMFSEYIKHVGLFCLIIVSDNNCKKSRPGLCTNTIP